MEKANVIDWWSAETHVLLNPRIPADERERLERLAWEAALPGHVWLATSGTTGLKLCALSKQALLASAAAVNRHLDATVDDRWCCVLPTFHVGGLGIDARAALSGTNVIAAEWDAARFAELCEQQRITLTSLVPTQIGDLLRQNVSSPSTLRAVVVGSDALAPELYRQARRLGWKLLPSYGMTECGSQIATAALDSMASDAVPPLELLPHLRGRREEDGRLAFSGASLLSGYLTETGLLDPKVGGWFITEDYGTIDKRIVSVTGRGRDFVKIGGETVNLRRLERILDELAPGADASLLALPDERLGHIIALAVTPSCDSPSELMSSFNDRVLPFERIRETRVVERIPRSPLGKVLVSELRRLLDSPLPSGQRGPG